MSNPTKIYMLEAVLEQGSAVRMQFTSKDDADAARSKIAEGMAKGRFQSEDIAHIVSDASTYDIRVSQVVSVSVNDTTAWNDLAKSIGNTSETAP